MKTALYYFSTTGNSLTTAKIITSFLKNSKIIPITALRSQSKVIVETSCVGFIFPVYYGNMPWIVREVISKMVFKPDTYAFIFTTYRGHAGAVAQRTDQLLRTRGIKLSLARGISMPGNSFLSQPEIIERQLLEQTTNIQSQLCDIQNHIVENNFEPNLIPQTPIDYPNNFRGIIADENCIGCGLCAQICPMNNIKLENNHAVIGDDCSTCLACFHWCPKEAVWMSQQPNIARREKYHHPNILVDDILSQKTLNYRKLF